MKNKIASVCFLLWIVSCASKTSINSSQNEKVALLNCPLVVADKAPQMLWLTEKLDAPESAIYDSKTNSIYVSNVMGSPVEKDGKGWISKLSLSGKVVSKYWAKGLNAPKGMRILNGTLWVSDIDQVHGISLSNPKKRISVTIEGAKFLNDIAFNADYSKVLVSDMLQSKIYAVSLDGSSSVFMDAKELENPNGLLLDGQNLFVASWGANIQADFSTPKPGRVLTIDLSTQKINPWTQAPMGNLDGIERDGPDAVLVSDWVAGKVYRLRKNGECVTLLEGFQGSADLGFVSETRTLLLPEMNTNKLHAFKLPKF